MSPTKITFRGLLVWIICAVFFTYEFLLRTVLGTFQFPIMDELQLSSMKFSLLSSTAYQVIYGAMQLPVGIITDRFGLKKTLLFAVIVCGIANVGFAMSYQYAFAFIFRVLMGFGSAFGFVCLLMAVYDWMPKKNFALFIGLSQFVGTLGPMLAAGPLNMLAEAGILGWRSLFLSLSVFAGVLSLLVYLFVDNRHESTGKFLILSLNTSILDSLKRIVKQPQIWAIAFFSATIYFSIEYLSENEGVAFLTLKGFSSSFASYLITVAWLGYAISCPVLGFLSDRFERRKPLMIASAVIMLSGLVGMIYFPLGYLSTALCFLCIGIGAGGQSIGFAVVSEYCKESYVAAGLAFNNGMIMCCSAINAPLMGYILSLQSSTSLSSYQMVFSLMTIIGIIALLMSFMVKETFCKSMRENTIIQVR